jgi:hypothetical protein
MLLIHSESTDWNNGTHNTKQLVCVSFLVHSITVCWTAKWTWTILHITKNHPIETVGGTTTTTTNVRPDIWSQGRESNKDLPTMKLTTTSIPQLWV